MDDVLERLGETAKKTLASYEAWIKDKANEKHHEELADAVHELRKVASRVEIEMAVIERDEQSRTPIPIPPHRSQKAGNESSNILDAQPEHGNSGGSNKPRRQNNRNNNNNRPRRKPSGGGNAGANKNAKEG